MMKKHSTNHYKKINTIWKPTIIKLYSEGKSLSDIATKYKVAKETIRQRLIKWGVKIKPYIDEKKYHYKKSEIIYLYMSSGLSINRIATRLKLKQKELSKKIKEWGYYDEISPNRRINYQHYGTQKELYKKWKAKRK